MNKNNIILTQANCFTPTEAGEYFVQKIREFDTINNTQWRIEEHFFKTLCFYYFEIDKKTTLENIEAYWKDVHIKMIDTWKRDVQELFWEYLIQFSIDAYKWKIGAQFQDQIWNENSTMYTKEMIENIIMKIIGTIWETEKFAKVCHWFAKSLREKWKKTYTTLSTQDKLLNILSLQSFDSLESYASKWVNKNKLAKKLGKRDPRAFKQAKIKSEDILFYFFWLENIKTPTDIMIARDTIKNIISVDKKREDMDNDEYLHKIIDVTDIKEIKRKGKPHMSVTCTYIEWMQPWSMLHTLLHNSFAHEQETATLIERLEEDMIEHGSVSHQRQIITNEFEYIYKAIRDLQAYIDTTNIISIPVETWKEIETSALFLDIEQRYWSIVSEIFEKALYNNSQCIVKIWNDVWTYSISSYWRSVILKCSDNGILLQYYQWNICVWEQQITVIWDNYALSAYTAPWESIINHWCQTYWIDDYITSKNNIEIWQYTTELLLYINDWKNTYKKLDTVKAYTTYLLENCISNDTNIEHLLKRDSLYQDTLDEKQLATIKNFAITNISKEIYAIFSKWLDAANQQWNEISEDSKSKNKEVFMSFLNDIWISGEITEDSFVDHIENNWDQVSKASQLAHNHSIYGARSYKSILTYENRMQNSLEEILQKYFIKKIRTRDKHQVIKIWDKNIIKKPHLLTLKSVYDLCTEYDILTYLRSKNSNPKTVQHIQSTLQQYNDMNIERNNSQEIIDTIEEVSDIRSYDRMEKKLRQNIETIVHKYCSNYLVNNIKIAALEAYKEHITTNPLWNKPALENYKKLFHECTWILEKTYKTIYPNILDDSIQDKIQSFCKNRYIDYNLWAIPSQEKELQILSLNAKIASLQALQASFVWDDNEYFQLFQKYSVYADKIKDIIYKKNGINIKKVRTIKEKDTKRLSTKDRWILHSFKTTTETIEKLTWKIWNNKHSYHIPKEVIDHKIFDLYAIATKAIWFLKNQNTAWYNNTNNDFIDEIEQIKESVSKVYSTYNTDDITKKAQLLAQSKETLQSFMRLFPWRDNAVLTKKSNKLRQTIIKNKHAWLQTLIVNNMQEYEKCLTTHNELITEYQTQLELENNIIKNTYGKKNKIHNIENSVSLHKDFPTLQKLWYKNIENNITEEAFRIDIIQWLFRQLPPHAQTLIQWETITWWSILGNQFLKTTHETHKLLLQLPYISDEYANAYLYWEWEYQKKHDTNMSNRIREYISHHLKKVIIYLIEEKRVQEYIDTYITIENETLKSMFIKSLDKIIIDVLREYKWDLIIYKWSYENILFEDKWGIFDKDVQLMGTLHYTLPQIEDDWYQSVENIDFEDINSEK